jgi:site-specific DNA-cytosine methylase
VVSGNEPSPTQGVSAIARGMATGRVVKMTPRALARFQSFPDWYELPARNALACKIIGNAVPPLLMRRVMEAQ